MEWKQLGVCDVCGLFRETNEYRLPVVFTTEQDEGRPCKPYVAYTDLEVCTECLQASYGIRATGAMGRNEYRLVADLYWDCLRDVLDDLAMADPEAAGRYSGYVAEVLYRGLPNGDDAPRRAEGPTVEPERASHNCATCAHYEPNGSGGEGECRRFPPTYMGPKAEVLGEPQYIDMHYDCASSSGWWLHPVTNALGGCGEWARRDDGL